ncbi:MAG: glycosyltransferase family 4 protein [Candidatus Omnitrophica bacterium]|nr:glycosyltransferase family 4 protein [Candidatus Omnitrophota bacterium]
MNEEDVQRIRERFGLPQMFILFVGSFQVRKNLPGLIRAYNLFLSKYQLPHHLVIVGKTRQDIGSNYLKNKDLTALIENKERIHFIGYQEEEDLVGIYNAAELFVLVSFYEGFGFPYLEAMSCGTPVVGANNSSGTEIIGDAGILVNPLNPEEIADSMASCLTDGQLRQSMIDKGLKRVKEFTISRMAEETLQIYQEVCE